MEASEECTWHRIQIHVSVKADRTRVPRTPLLVWFDYIFGMHEST